MPISAMLPTVDAEMGDNVVLPISAKRHPFSDRDLSVIQCHVGLSLSEFELRFDQYAIIRAQSCVRGNVNPQISRLGNGPDRDPNPARRSLDLQRQSCPASREGRRGISKSAAVGAGPVVFRGSGCSVTNCTDGRSNCSLTTAFTDLSADRHACGGEGSPDKPVSISGTWIDRLPISSARSAFHSPASHSRRCSNR
jgi:hypothetical protein